MQCKISMFRYGDSENRNKIMLIEIGIKKEFVLLLLGCCIYKKQLEFGESSSESEDECDHCFGHVEKKKKHMKKNGNTGGDDDADDDHANNDDGATGSTGNGAHRHSSSCDLGGSGSWFIHMFCACK